METFTRYTVFYELNGQNCFVGILSAIENFCAELILVINEYRVCYEITRVHVNWRNRKFIEFPGMN